MAENKEIKARVLLKHDTAANWDSASKNGFKPKVAEPIFYDDLNKLKVGDGVKTPNELPFLTTKSDLPLENGIGENSLQQTTSQAISQYGVAFGVNATAGLRGYYFKYIDFTNKKIYLSATNTEYKTSGYGSIDTDINPSTGGWAKDDQFSLVAGNHFILCGTIKSISPGFIEYDGDLKWNNEVLTKSIFDSKIATLLVAPSKIEIDDFSISVPKKPMVGDKVISIGGTTFGGSTVAAMLGFAEGYECIAAGQSAHAEGQETVAGYAAHSEGDSTIATGQYSHAEGFHSSATGMGAHAEGNYTTAKAEYAHTEGSVTSANGKMSHVEGERSTIGKDGLAAHAEGSNTKASAKYSHAEGYLTTVSSGADAAHASGIGTIAKKEAQFVIGKFNNDDANAAFIIGGGSGSISKKDNGSASITKEERKNIFTVDWDGNVNLVYGTSEAGSPVGGSLNAVTVEAY